MKLDAWTPLTLRRAPIAPTTRSPPHIPRTLYFCQVTERSEWSHITDAQLSAAAATFLGDILQIPPMFSAIKKGGVKLYDMAREGIEIEREPRPVTIMRFDVSRTEPGSQFVNFDVVRSMCSCGSGEWAGRILRGIVEASKHFDDLINSHQSFPIHSSS